VEVAGKAARKAVWTSRDASEKSIRAACVAALAEVDPTKGTDPNSPVMWWSVALAAALADDLTIRSLPDLIEVDKLSWIMEDFWKDSWQGQDKSDMARALSFAEATVELPFEMGLHDHANQADIALAKALFLKRLRLQFPGYPVTSVELRDYRYRQLVLTTGERFAVGLSAEAKEQFLDALQDMAYGKLSVPVDCDAVSETRFANSVPIVGLSQLERCRVIAALLQTAAVIHSEQCQQARCMIHPICGYAIVLGPGAGTTVTGTAPGLWRLRVEGQQYIIQCELWARPVVMSHQEFGRARGSSHAILRDVGVSVDSPPGHWKTVWEKHGLRDQLLAAAERVDQRVRVTQLWEWVARIAADAPAAHRPAIDGSAVRLADGATVVDPRWLIEQALAEGVIMPHEKSALEKEVRRHARETNRRDEAKRQRKLLVIDAALWPAGIPYIDTRERDASEKQRNR